MEKFPLKLELRIDWSEIDAFGHLNNLAFMKYLQSARVDFLEKLGLMQSQCEEGIGSILAAINCQFRQPLFYPGRVTVYSKVVAVKTASFIMRHEINNEAGELAAESEDVIVLYDFAKGVKLAIPNELREKLESFK
jgi:acyl-CoA thioester hydrolase